MTPATLSRYFCLGENHTDSLISELQSRDFIEPFEDGFKLTIKGNALCVANCVPPIKREKADKIFQEFMQRVEEVNNDNSYLLRISKLFLFGSYLNPDNPDYGDIDIAFELERKIEDYGTFMNLNLELAYEAQLNGKQFSSIIDKLSYSQNLVLQKLKNRNRYISLHPISDDFLKGTKHKQIYPY